MSTDEDEVILGYRMVDRRCGFGPLKNNRRLQKCANLTLYAVVAGFIIFGVTAAYSYMSSVQTTTQTVFSFSASDIGIWYAMFEVGSVISNVIASYFFTHKHIPRVLSFGLILMTTGCLIHGLAHFFVDYDDKVQSTGEEQVAADYIITTLCRSQNESITSVNVTTTVATVQNTGSRTLALIAYSFAGFLMGLGYAPFWSLGLVYIDDNVRDSHESTKYFGVILAFYTIGPVLGFGAGAFFLDQYVTLGETYLSPEDSQWIGAYWVGYIVFAVYLLIFLPFIFMFPKRLPQQVDNSVNVSMKKVSTTSTSSQNVLTTHDYTEDSGGADDQPTDSTKTEIRSVKGLLPTLMRLLINPLYILEVTGSCTAVYYLSGWIGFLPQYFEVQFAMSASLANILAGAVPPLFGFICVFAGGYMSSRVKLTTQQNAKMIFVSVLVSLLFLIPMFFLVCEQVPVQDPSSVLPNSSLAQDCNCNTDDYIPVCYEGKTFKSPCVVGCTGHIEQDDGDIIYTECLQSLNATMTSGACGEENCSAPYIYMVLAVLSMGSFLFSSSAGVNIIVRSVNEEDRSFALGIQSILNSLLAWVPSPILYGNIIDGICEIWEFPNGSPEDPEWYGYCVEYRNEEYRLKYLGITVGMMALTCVLCGAAIPVSYMKRYIENEPKTDDDDTFNSVDNDDSYKQM